MMSAAAPRSASDDIGAWAFVRKLQHGAELDAADQARLLSLALRPLSLTARQELQSEGEGPRTLPLVLEGWVCRYRILENGKRQITSLYVPGDLCEPFGVLPLFMDHPVAALTPARVARVAPEELKAVARSSPGIEHALWWDLLMMGGIERERIVSLGRRTATERIGHLFCELHSRFRMIGRADANSFDLPLTQADLSDLLGLSAVHINRSLQELRRIGLVSHRDGRVVLPDRQDLERVSHFDPGYLHAHGSRPEGDQPVSRNFTNDD